MNNNIVGLDLIALDFSGASYSVSGNAITLSQRIQVGADISATIDLSLSLSDDVVFSSSGGLNVEGDIDLNGSQLDLDSSNDIQLLGVISGTGDVLATGELRVIVWGDNTFTGDIILSGGSSIYFTSGTGPGNVNNVISSIGPGAYIGFDGPGGITIANDIEFIETGYIINFTANNTLSGDVVIDDSVRVYSESTNFTISGVISGDGYLVKDSAGDLAISGSVSNTFTGGLNINRGTVTLAKTSGAVAVNGGVNVGAGVYSSDSVVLNQNSDEQITGHVIVGSDGLWNVTQSETIGNLSGSGKVVISNAVNLILFNTLDATFSGILEGEGNILKVGAAEWLLTNDSPFEGIIYSSEGTITVNGDISEAEYHTQGGAFKGTGTLGVTLAESGGIIPGDEIGILTISDYLYMDQDNAIYIDIAGTNAGTDYDRLVVNGDVELVNTYLNINLTYTPLYGSSFTILQTVGGTIVGEFNGLPNLSPISLGGKEFKIIYTENSVVLKSEAELYLLNFSSSHTSIFYGVPFTLNVQWGSNGIMPTGVSTFAIGSTELGVVNLVNGAGSITINNLPVGTYSIIVTYSGDDLFNGAYSNPITITVSYEPQITPIQFASTPVVNNIKVQTPPSSPASYPELVNNDTKTEVSNTELINTEINSPNSSVPVILIIGTGFALALCAYYLVKRSKN
jgi:autotransporter-associated beta strand protein